MTTPRTEAFADIAAPRAAARLLLDVADGGRPADFAEAAPVLRVRDSSGLDVSVTA